jgi:ABC-type nitrate/sulfonate/bicarbonate transport system ATPase subunit/ABC-type nitrate/sulfonate/bicarbonate transport system substrate-binding protein
MQLDAIRNPASRIEIELKDIRVAYARLGGRAALPHLDGWSLSVKAGEKVAILGRSGSGKTTLLNVVAGLVEPAAGEVRFGRKRENGPSFAYVFQEDRLLPWRTAEGNVRLALERLGVPRALRRALAREALARVGLADAATLFPSQLSGGMRSRVALARALALDAPLLLLDEPFSKLDPATRTEMHQLLLRLHEEIGFAALLVTHDPEEAALLADRAVVLRPRASIEVDIASDREAAASRLRALLTDAAPIAKEEPGPRLGVPRPMPIAYTRRAALALAGGALAAPLVGRRALAAEGAAFRIGYWATGIQLALIELIKERRLFEKHGLKPELVSFADVNGNTVALATNRIDGAFSVSGAGALDLAAKKRPVRILLSTQIADGQLVTNKPGIETVGDLRGCVIGLAPAGSAGHAYAKAFLSRNHGLEPDAYRVAGGGEARIVQLLVKGDVDAALLREVSVVQFAERLKLRALANQLIEWGRLAGPGARPPLGVAVTRLEVIEKRREDAVAFIAAVIDAIRIGAAEPDLVAGLMARSLKLSPDEAAAYAKTWNITFHGKLEPADIASFEIAQRLFVEEGSLEAAAEPQYFDPTIYRDALTRIGSIQGRS